ncbi:MAG TPA: hypothetical protein PL115_06865 [Bacteroidales bacterium]|jgi:MFS-type transporter involved in bile tolerance (Atg22 family)|nr:hypothetical protein [Bacteroidales bacterium]HPY22424.1 hypothetical protein [Bacteroidales bacterium]HQN23577.1 hypothetical protein [Bacteroidales bacterium]HQP79566.1 hypothetical protein [Bacteroidales bacterium]
MCRKDNFEHQIQKITKISEYCHFLAARMFFFAVVKKILAVTEIKKEHSYGKENIYKRDPGRYAGMSRAD